MGFSNISPSIFQRVFIFLGGKCSCFTAANNLMRIILFLKANFSPWLSHWSDLVLDVGLLLACLGIKSNRITWLLNDWFSFLVTSLLHTVQVL